MRSHQVNAARLSQAVPSQPEGEKLSAKDLGIEKLDIVKWNPEPIKYVSLEFNNIEVIRSLGQFKNIVGLDLANNNVD